MGKFDVIENVKSTEIIAHVHCADIPVVGLSPSGFVAYPRYLSKMRPSAGACQRSRAQSKHKPAIACERDLQPSASISSRSSTLLMAAGLARMLASISSTPGPLLLLLVFTFLLEDMCGGNPSFKTPRRNPLFPRALFSFLRRECASCRAKGVQIAWIEPSLRNLSALCVLHRLSAFGSTRRREIMPRTWLCLASDSAAGLRCSHTQ